MTEKSPYSRTIPPVEIAIGVADSTVQETAAELRCTPATIYNLLRRGELRAYKVGTKTLVRADSIEDLKGRNAFVPVGVA